MRVDAATIIDPANDRTDAAPAPGSADRGGDDPEQKLAVADAWSAGVAMLTATFNNVRHGFLLLDNQMRVRSFNPRLAELIGFSPGVLHEGASAYSLIAASTALGHYPGLSVDEAYELWTKRLAKRAPGHHSSRSTDGRTTRIGCMPFGEGEWIITYQDISARVNAEEALARQNERFQACLANIRHGVCMFDSNKRLILCNAGYARLYGLPPELTAAGVELKRMLDFRASIGAAPLELSAFYEMVGEAEAAGDVRNARVALQDGRTIRVTYNPMRGGGFVAVHEDITEALRAERQIRYLGSHDALTGLPNRIQLNTRIGEALARARRGEMFCLHYLDLDNFKFVNDAHGHSIGDLLLRQVVARLRTPLRETDTLARIGGDEFVVLQADLETPDQASDLAARLDEAMAEPFDLDGRQAFVGVSIGVTVCPSDGADADILLKNADLAMYRAKSEGRNTYRFFELTMDARIQARRLLELELRRAVAAQEFELHYQPQVDASSEAITGFEALVRWRHPRRGLVPPLEFIGIAEEIGIIVPLGAWVIQQACRDAAAWPKHIGVAVNLSSKQFKGLSLVQTVVDALGASGLSPLRLELEITESVLLADCQSTIATLGHLRALGVRIAMDDFGTGYSSLSYLRRFPFDKIKIDRSFIKDFGKTNDCSAIVRAVAGMGAELGMITTAEGVETAEQLQQIRSLGCTEVQGYYFGKPRPVNELAAMLERFAAVA